VEALVFDFGTCPWATILKKVEFCYFITIIVWSPDINIIHQMQRIINVWETQPN
jgi:hypothetical protein